VGGYAFRLAGHLRQRGGGRYGPWLEGYPARCHPPDAPIDRFVRQVAAVGSTQHWIMAYGGAAAEVIAFLSWRTSPELIA
jgi:hypothetical protein